MGTLVLMTWSLFSLCHLPRPGNQKGEKEEIVAQEPERTSGSRGAPRRRLESDLVGDEVANCNRACVGVPKSNLGPGSPRKIRLSR
jgi:hypothetical protein